MKLIKITILASLFLFSCSSDDDAGPKYKAGWNDQLIELSAQECAEGPEGIDIEFCRCSTKEAAKLFTLEEIVAKLLLLLVDS